MNTLMIARYYVGSDGKKLEPQSGEYDHIDTARRFLAAARIKPADLDDVYNQMARLGFMRVVEEPGFLLVDNNRKDITPAQKDYMMVRQAEMKRDFGKDVAIRLNGELLESTRKGRKNADKPIGDMLRKAMDGTMGS
jgi:hypothetical protein